MRSRRTSRGCRRHDVGSTAQPGAPSRRASDPVGVVLATEELLVPHAAPGGDVGSGGGIIGEHTVLFASDDEVLTLSHSAIDRSLFAKGAVAAAAWVRSRKPGLYDMQDVLGLKE